MAITSRPKSGFFIGVTCPGCGGELRLQEDFFVLECSHCGSILRVVMPDSPPAYIIAPKKEKREVRFRVDRHLKERGLPLTQSDFSLERIYYPYWKVDGLQLKMPGVNINQAMTRKVVNVLTTQIDYVGMFQVGRAVGACLTDGGDAITTQSRDTSVRLVPYHSNQMAGPEVSGIPYSLGMRTDYVEMSPYTQDDIDERFDYVPVSKPWDVVLAQINGKSVPRGMAGADPNYPDIKTVLQPKGSVVYFPYFICKSGGRRLVVDGLNGRVVHEENCRKEESRDWPDPHLQFGRLTVILHRCPTCGEDLPSTQSHVYICNNCHTVVSLDENNPLEEKVLSACGKQKRQDPMFPFWVFKLHRKTVSKIAKLSVMGPPPNRLVIPAFRIANFKVTQRLTQRITAAFQQFPKEPVESFDQNFRSVDVSLSEAKTLAEICLFCEKAVKKPGLRPEKVKINPRGVELFYAPFHAENYFYVDSIINTVTFAKNTVGS